MPATQCRAADVMRWAVRKWRRRTVAAGGWLEDPLLGLALEGRCAWCPPAVLAVQELERVRNPGLVATRRGLPTRGGRGGAWRSVDESFPLPRFRVELCSRELHGAILAALFAISPPVPVVLVLRPRERSRAPKTLADDDKTRR